MAPPSRGVTVSFPLSFFRRGLRCWRRRCVLRSLCAPFGADGTTWQLRRGHDSKTQKARAFHDEESKTVVLQTARSVAKSLDSASDVAAATAVAISSTAKNEHEKTKLAIFIQNFNRLYMLFV